MTPELFSKLLLSIVGPLFILLGLALLFWGIGNTDKYKDTFLGFAAVLMAIAGALTIISGIILSFVSPIKTV